MHAISNQQEMLLSSSWLGTIFVGIGMPVSEHLHAVGLPTADRAWTTTPKCAFMSFTQAILGDEGCGQVVH